MSTVISKHKKPHKFAQFDGKEGVRGRRRKVHYPKVDRDLIDFLESSDINLLDRSTLGKFEK